MIRELCSTLAEGATWVGRNLRCVVGSLVRDILHSLADWRSILINGHTRAELEHVVRRMEASRRDR